MRDSRHDGTKFDAAQIEHGSEEQRDDEQGEEDRCVPRDRADGNDGETDQGAGTKVAVFIGERLDEHVRDGEDDSHAHGPNDLGNQHGAPSRAGNVAGKFLRRMAESFLLVTGDHRPRETAVTDPGVGVRSRVTAGHPAKVLAVIDDEVGERELMRVENEGSDREREHGDPEIDQVRHPDGHGHEEQRQERPHAEIDTRSGETRVESAKVHAGRREASTGGDVPSTTKGQVAQDRMSVDLSRENFENGR